MRIMNDPQCSARFLLVHHMRAFLGAHCATFAAPVMQAATALIADTATELKRIPVILKHSLHA